jgi:predicted RecB family nuclease
MQRVSGRLVVSPTDLANFLACRHKTALDRLVAEGRLARPAFVDPLAAVLRQRGEEHERRYVNELRASGLAVVDLGSDPPEARAARTLRAMAEGADVIVQAALGDGAWRGYADVLRKVPEPSPAFGAWSYEATDTKLARETRGGTILQLGVYSALVAGIQGRSPERCHVVTPLGAETYRVSDFAAFHRQVTARFLDAVSSGPAVDPPASYPDPVEHCGVCRWSAQCNQRRRADDHLSFVAGLGRHHQAELSSRGVTTLAALAALPVPIAFTPRRGARDTYERLREQARLQLEQRTTGQPTFELLPVDPAFGLSQLPAPRPGDLFLDLEGDPFGRPTIGAVPGEGSREYLFGLGSLAADGSFTYTARWAFTDTDERQAFEAVIAEIIGALDRDPAIHVYHYAPYEPATFKRLMGRYASSEAELDRLLRGRRFVDLYAIVRHALRAGVERYSIKNLEPFYAFVRDVELDEAGDQRRLVETALEANDLSPVTGEVRAAVEGYNRDDCRSAAELRRWLEALRAAEIAEGGHDIARPPLEPDAPNDNVRDRQQRINALRARLVAGVPGERVDRTADEHARYLLAYLIDWHDREDKVSWWEYYRLRELPDEDLADEPAAVAELAFVERLRHVVNVRTRKPTGSVIDRYRYPSQECEIRDGAKLKLRDGTLFGEVVSADRLLRTLDVKKGPSKADLHPSSAFQHEHVSSDEPADALFRLGEAVANGGFSGAPRAATDLLLGRTAPDVQADVPGATTVSDRAVHIVRSLAGGMLAIQGPPGSGKTYTAARMIVELVRDGRRVGVTATGHKVIRNLLKGVAKEAAKTGRTVRLGHKVHEAGEHGSDGVLEFESNDSAHDAITSRTIDVLGGTAWMWARQSFMDAVDVIFIDEAGQMSLANALVVSQAAPGLVLLGDPQQLEQPQKGSHPEGVGVSALEHVLDGHQTMPANRGLFLPITWRLAPAISAFTSEVFYEGKLRPRNGLERQRITGAGRFDGAGLRFVEIDHAGCRNASDEEADAVAGIVTELAGAGVHWIDSDGDRHALTPDDVMIVAPYNAHVRRIEERLMRVTGAAAAFASAVRVGTVDRFQGQEAPVVIYSMATSHPDDAPRGMGFLYSLNRLNVATSRAKCVAIVVLNPSLFEPDCRTPREMRLANALARYREMAMPLSGRA